jgi:hypothetical protein
MKYRLLCTLALALALPMAARAAVSVSINIAPPPLPVYVQPEIPAPGYLWTPGYWRWDPAGADYFWVPGTWMSPPAVGLLWTPGYWGWGNGGYFWHTGYWGRHVGFYGGVNYGFGYGGSGYHGGYWRDGVFNYNRSVNHINERIVHNIYNERIVENNTRVSFNGGQGGLAARESAEERAVHAEHHFAPTPMQHQHEQVAMRSPEQRAAFNHGAPTMAAMPRPSSSRAEGNPRGQAMHAGPPGRMAAPQQVERAGPSHEAPQRVERAAPQHQGRDAPQHVEPGGEHRGGGSGGRERER